MVSLAIHYFAWHYTQAVRDIMNIIGNFLWFFYKFFSIQLLLRTLFVPFHRLDEHARSRLDVGAVAQTFLVNMLMRVVGALMRLFVILIGIILIVCTVVVGLGMLLLWLFAPVVVVVLLGMALLFLKS